MAKRIGSICDNVRPLRAIHAVTAAIAFFAMQIFIVFYIFPQRSLTPLRAATFGLIQPSLVANLAILGIVVGLILVRTGGQRRYDIGWTGS